ncbi:MAG: hypothetical protein ACOYT9_03480 [Patescibacteria group bacterium]
MPLPGDSANRLSRLRELRRNQPILLEPISDRVNEVLEESDRVVIIDNIWISTDNTHVVATGQAAHGTDKGHLQAILFAAGDPKEVKMTADSLFLVRVYPKS